MDATYHYYMRDQSVLETRNGSDDSLSQYLWASDIAGGYLDELCQVTQNADPQDGGEQDCEYTYVAVANANYNVQALLIGDATTATFHGKSTQIQGRS